MYSNVRGIKGKKASLIEILSEHEPQVFLLTETLLRSNSGTSIEGYTFYSKARSGKSGGGVGILVRNDIKINTAPHITDRDIEIMWISVRRKNLSPVIIGTYYGKQESRTSKEEIEREMFLLKEEIIEMGREGEIFLCMDGNAKIGVLGEPISRNGSQLLNLFEETNLTVMNLNDKCSGKVTRKNTKNPSEQSAIDFVAVSPTIEKWIERMFIDEEETMKIKGKNPTDHNTMMIDIKMTNIDKTFVVKRTSWNLKASSEKWAVYTNQIKNELTKAQDLLSDVTKPIDERYKTWLKGIEKSAWTSIGKTTSKERGLEKFSEEVSQKRTEKRQLKDIIQGETDNGKKKDLISQYKDLQDEIKDMIVKERTEKIEQKFQRIASDNSRTSFWREKRAITKNPVLESLIVKDANGKRIYCPERIKEVTANYYENLYKDKNLPSRPFHTQLTNQITQYLNDIEHENDLCNTPPTEKEISEIIAKKKNGKSTTDIKNEMLKRPGDVMTKYVFTLIQAIWNEETVPESWRCGLVTSIWKGKGDRESLQNHRGITVSSTIGSIMEEIIDRRILETVKFTPAQGGGLKGASTCDHIFILKTLISVSLKQKRKTYVTFYDVQKAFDNVDNDDMLAVMWQNGLRGKAWRILKELSNNLKAKIKTKHGTTREVNMEIGGKQGSKITGRMFSKMMDVLSEEIIEEGTGFKITTDFIIGALLWVDDVVSCVEGEDAQKQILQKIDIFAKDHKLKWGNSKCKVMPIGKHSNVKEWEFGDEKIQTCEKYTYLGEIITSDGKNKENIQERKRKITVSTLSINTIASNEVLNRIETPVLLELHERINVPTLLSNAEAWVLSKGDQKDLEQIEVNSLKNLFDLPVRTPTPAIIHTLGALQTTIRVDKKQLLYLHRLLTRENNHWTARALQTLKDLNLGWYSQIKSTLEQYGLETNFDVIKKIPSAIWRNQITMATEVKHRELLIDSCYKQERDQKVAKTKTKSILPNLEGNDYKRGPIREILSLTKHECKILIIARFGMLECGKNFRGTITEKCVTCNESDDEEHRLNKCTKYSNINHMNDTEIIPFDTIFSSDLDLLRIIFDKIDSVWNVRTGHGTMHT